MLNNTYKYAEKRKGPDILIKTVKWIGIVSWGFILTVLLLIDQAKPQVETFFDKLFEVQLRHTWDFELLRYAFLLMIILFFLCAAALFINSRRKKRKTDKYNRSVIILTVMSLVGMIVYLINMQGN